MKGKRYVNGNYTLFDQIKHFPGCVSEIYFVWKQRNDFTAKETGRKIVKSNSTLVDFRLIMMVSIISQRIVSNGTGILRGQRHILGENWPKYLPPQKLSPCHRRILRVDIDDQLSISKSVPNLSSKRQHSVNYRYSGKRKMHDYFMKKNILCSSCQKIKSILWDYTEPDPQKKRVNNRNFFSQWP